MTKTKRQLRAEAVERLKMLDEHGGGSFEYAILGSDKIAWRYMDKRDALIDLLTDDDANDDSAPENGVSDPDGGSNVAYIAPDSREKLEADANAVAIDYWHRERTWDDANDLKRDVIALLDRQAAITKRECMDTRINFAERVRFGSCIDELIAERDHLRRQVDMLNEQVIELTQVAESKRVSFADRIRFVNEIDELTDERDELTKECSALDKQCTALEEELERVRAERDELREENEALREWKVCYERMRDERDELVKQRNSAESNAKTQRNNYEQVSSARLHWQKKAREAEAERDEYREKLSRALDLAHEIGRLQP